MTAYETKDIEHNGAAYRVEYHYDEDMGAPWEEHDGHGIVSDWTSRSKRAGEVSIAEDRGSHRFYDVAATTELAKRDGWGLSPEEAAGLTPGQVTARAVQRDLEFCRGWLNDEWHWMGVVVFPLTVDGDELKSKTQALWGLESTAGDYLDEVAQELIEQIEG